MTCNETTAALRYAYSLWARLSILGVDAPPQIYRALLHAAARNGEHCFYCGIEVTVGTETNPKLDVAGRRAVWDHVVPRCQGGSSYPANLVLSCTECNQSKSGRTPQQWRQECAA
jgi:hypothetical protein